MTNIIRWHHPAGAYAHLQNVPGIGLYGDRSLVFKSPLAIVLRQRGQGELTAYLQYLKEVGIGPEEVMELEDLYTPTSDVLYQVRGLLDEHATVQFFHDTLAEERILDQLGVGWRMVYGLTPKASDIANCKANLRREGAMYGWNGFPAHHLVTNRLQAMEAVRSLGAGGGEIILKAPRLASGDGMVFVSTLTQTEGVVDDLLQRGDGELIVETAYRDHVPMSIIWFCGRSGPEKYYATAQIIDPDGVTHRGNIVSTSNQGLPRVSWQNVQAMKDISVLYAQHHHDPSTAGGILGYDFLSPASAPDSVFLLECNARVPASSHAIGVLEQVEERLGGRAAVAMAIVEPTREISSLSVLKELLGEQLFDGHHPGVLPFVIRLLPKKVGLMAIQKTATDAVQQLDEVCQMLTVV